MPRWHVDRGCRRYTIATPLFCRLSRDSEGRIRPSVKGLTENLSELGAMVSLPEPFPPGTQIEVEFSFPELGVIPVDAIIVWVMESPQGQGDLPFRHGLRFLRPEMTRGVLSLVQPPSSLAPQEAPIHLDQDHKEDAIHKRTETKLTPSESLVRPVDGKNYEVLLKFRRQDQKALQTLFESTFQDISFVETKDGEIVLAHCRFYGDLSTLDQKLEDLRQSAMVVVGEPQEATVLSFFVALQDVGGGRQSGPRKRLTPPPLPTPWRTYLLFLVAGLTGLLMAIELGVIPRLSLRTAPGPPPQHLDPVEPSILPWQPYVESTYHKDWLSVKEKYRLNDQTMLELFRLIKRIDSFSPGHSLSNLTLYPKAIDRALGLLILKDIDNPEGLKAFLPALNAYFASGHPFPDEPEFSTETRYGALATLDKAFNQRIILAFYEQLLSSNKALTNQLLGDLHSFSSSPPPRRSLSEAY